MFTRPLAILCALTMLASLFVSWLSSPFGPSIVPWDAIRQMDQATVQNMLENAPPEVMVFLASFAVAAVFLLLALFRLDSKLMAFVTGALPLGLVGWVIVSAMNGANRAGLPLPSGNDLPDLLSKAAEALGPGVWMWLGGAACLLVLGIFDPGRRRD